MRCVRSTRLFRRPPRRAPTRCASTSCARASRGSHPRACLLGARRYKRSRFGVRRGGRQLKRFAPAGFTLLLLATIVFIGRPTPATPEVLAWQPAGELAAPRAYGAALTLTTGEILVVGGLDRDDPHVVNFTTELFDPVTGRTTVLAQLLPGRVNGTLTAGWGGRVVMARGSEWQGDHWAVMGRVDVY